MTRATVPAPDVAAAAPRRVGPARLLVWVYAVFVVAAGSRSAVQLATHPGRAPLAYTLSALAATVYVAGFVLVLRAERGGSRRAVAACCAVELAGVLTVGTVSVLAPSLFPDDSVWSDYGAGYLLVPLALPVGVLLWLRRGAR